MSTPNEHRKRIRRADAAMPAAIRNVLSQPEAPAETRDRQHAGDVRRMINRLDSIENELYAESHQDAKDAASRIHAAVTQLLIAAVYLEGE